MTLPHGTKLGPHEISPLGAGGMGEVYRARDTRLERTVAVKVLPEHLTANEDLRQRFDRETWTMSQLPRSPHSCHTWHYREPARLRECRTDAGVVISTS